MKISARLLIILKALPFLVLFVTIACSNEVRSGANAVSPEAGEKSFPPVTESFQLDSIVFLFLEIRNDTACANPTVNLLSIKKVKGRVKEPFTLSHPSETNYLKIQFLNNEYSVMKEMLMENPLQPGFEIVDEDGNYKWERPVLFQSDFVIRAQLKPDYKWLRMQTNNNLDTTILLF